MDLLKIVEHEHPLKLIDLQVEYPHYEEGEEDDGGDFIAIEGFRGVCYRCSNEIHMYHRYYYKCMDSSCDVSLHKFCAELATRLDNTLHPHPVILQQSHVDWLCGICKTSHKRLEMCYYCNQCEFCIDVSCAVEVGKKVIYHPCHPHLLMCAILKPILCECSACGKEHRGIFYQCTTCVGFTINSACTFLPKTLRIQETTDDYFSHTHPLTLTYSFPKSDQIAKHKPRCRVCRDDFFNKENLWIYKCDKCMYYAHVGCATSRPERSMSGFLPDGFDERLKILQDALVPGLLHLPFPDETYSIPKHLFFQESGTSYEVNPKHTSHQQHPLILVDQKEYDRQASSTISSLFICHDPMKKTQLLCNGCMRPIMSTMPFYKCTQGCNFTLHKWCTQLPVKRDNHPGHPQHSLVLMSKVLGQFFNVFNCALCRLPCNGFAYGCVECRYYVDVSCGFVPMYITHKSHAKHVLSILPKVFAHSHNQVCHMCLERLADDLISYHDSNGSHQIFYWCNVCDIYIHPECALLLSGTIRHRYDKHHIHLSYLPIENHKSEYFCEICEDDLNPHASFYHCQDCVQSIHTACAPLILECETDTYRYNSRSTYYFINIKFGDIHTSNGHKHPLLFAQGKVSDGPCNICGNGLQFKMIFKCLECKFAIDYHCCERLK